MSTAFRGSKRILLATVSFLAFPGFGYAQSFHTVPALQSEDTVTLYADNGFKGATRIFSQGGYAAHPLIATLDGFGDMLNNSASSIVVGSNATAWLCDHYTNGEASGVVPLGECHGFSDETTTLGGIDFNDLASTLFVTAGADQRSAFGAQAWVNAGFSGTSKQFKAGGYASSAFGGVNNNTISSLRVEPGFQAVACTADVGTQAECVMFPAGDYDQTVLAEYGMNESISWLSVIRETTNPAKIGEFGDVMDWTLSAIHMYLMTDGRVMFNESAFDDGDASTGEYGIWDPATNDLVFESTFAPGSNMFCGGYVHLPNGNLFGVATGGGGNTVDITMEYHVDTGRWELAPVMKHARYYPTATVTPEGDVLVTGGNDIDLWTKQGRQTPVPITIPEIYRDGAFESLPGAEFDFTNEHGPTNDSSYWPWVQAAPNGRMFVSGPDIQMRWLDTDGEGNLENIAPRFDNDVRTYGSYATYSTGLQVIAGGADSLATSAVIDFSGDTPVVTQTSDMVIGRRQFDMTVMADGNVFANGGISDGQPSYSLPGTIHNSEIFDVETQTWSLSADAQRPRQYHSTALLIPDGRVVTAGHFTKTKEYNAEIYSPPYLFNDDGTAATRPEITSVASSWAYSEVVPVSYGTTDVVSAHLIKLGAVTHATNMDQRLVPLDVVSNDAGEIEVTSPEGGNIAPPGHYMLFLMNSDGVPSVAEIVQVGVKGSDSIVLGNDTSSDGNFIDGHHPSLYVNETDTFSTAGPITVENFKFYARRLGNPITPLLLTKNADNDYTVVAVGTTRTSAQYSTGENTFPFSDGGTVNLTLSAGDTLVTGFMDANPDGSGWGGGTVIPADTLSNPDEIFDLLPQPLKSQSTAYNAAVVVPAVEVGERILSTNAEGLADGDLRIRGTLERSYKFAVTLSTGDAGGTPTGENLLVNGSFEEPTVTKWALSSAVPGWSSSTPIEIDRTPWPASDGDQSSDMNGNVPTTITQTVSGLTPGAPYLLSFDYASSRSSRSTVTMDVLVNGDVVQSIASPASAIPPAYSTETIAVTAPANGTVTIGFASTTAGSAGVVLDNVALHASAATPEIVNGSFEEPAVATWSLFDDIPGWNVVTGPVEVDRTPWPAAEGGQSVDLGGAGGSEIAQTLSGLTPGQTYTLSFAYGAHTNVKTSVSAVVKVNGATASTLTATSADKPPAYQNGSLSFTAPASGEVTVGFASVGSSSNGVVIDDVTLSVGGSVTPTDPVVENGSFELPDLSEDASLINKWDYVPSIPGWTTVQGEIEVMGDVADGAAWPASDGEQSLDLGAAAGAGPNATIIEQTVPGLVPGVAYNLTFDYGQHNLTKAEVVSANVYIDGSLVGEFVADDTMKPPAYQNAVVSFVATSNSVTIRFEHTTPVFHQGLTLDNVDISVAN